MNSYPQGQGFGRRGPARWLLPLAIGLVLGALVFGGRWNMFGGFGPGSHGRSYEPRIEQPAPPQEDRATGPRADTSRGHGSDRDHGHGPLAFGWHRGGFSLGGLLLSLALIGGGLWLLADRNRGSGGAGGSSHGPEQPASWNAAEHSPIPQQPGQSAEPTQPAQPTYTPPGPTTGPTRML